MEEVTLVISYHYHTRKETISQPTELILTSRDVPKVSWGEEVLPLLPQGFK